ncbi:MAG: ATP-binding protein [Acetobacteraceae bacterium]|nr:ATP-binding protein [Acetobacteraceae bacterium]
MADAPKEAGRTAADQTELEALRQENAILRQTLNAIDGTVVVYDAARRFVFANTAYHEFFPHLPPTEELAGQPYAAVLERSIDARMVNDPQAYTDRASFLARRVRALDRRDATPREIHDAESGHWYMIRVRHTPDGHRVALRVDITEQKRLQEALEQARATAERASQGKSQFLANVSHELRTPLNAVINFARLMAEQIHGPLGVRDYVDYAESIHHSGVDLLTLIERLLDFARADAGGLTLCKHAVNLRALLESVVRLLQPEASRLGITLCAAVPADLPPVLGDTPRLRQALFNVVSNAVKYTGREGRVDVSARALADDGGVEITIADNGPGIPPEDLARVLLPFERAAELHRPGIGLGLAMATRLVTLHGGHLTLDSTPGQGTVARMTLPATRVLAHT